MVRYTGKGDILEVVAEGMKSPHKQIELPTNEGILRFRVTATSGKIISGKTDDGRLVTIDPDDPDIITVT